MISTSQLITYNSTGIISAPYGNYWLTKYFLFILRNKSTELFLLTTREALHSHKQVRFSLLFNIYQ